MAHKTNAPQLVDVLTRHQVYLEGYKDGQQKDFNQRLIELKKELKSAFFEIDYQDLAQMPRKQLNDFIKQLRAIQYKFFTAYRTDLINEIEAYIKVDTKINHEILTQTEEDTKAKGIIDDVIKASGLLALIKQFKSSTMGSNGYTAEAYIDLFIANSDKELLAAMRIASANKYTLNQTLATIVGTTRLNNRNGLLNRYGYRGREVIGTIMQQAAGVVHNKLYEPYFDRYIWAAVIDSATSDICRYLNGRIYVYGDGPIPPAHPHCRSNAIPYVDGLVVPSGYKSWLSGQPAIVIKDILGSGTIDSDNLPRFTTKTGLTLKQFANKIDYILAK